MTGDPQVDHCIEVICQQGCRVVTQVIIEWEQQSKIPPAAVLLADAQQQIVLLELKAVMAVYSETGSCQV